MERLEVFAPWLAARVLHEDADVLVVDKPAWLVVHGDDFALGNDVVTRLKAWLAARGQHDYLGVHQRLDKGTSGVLFFTRRREVNAAIAPEMEAHRIARRYVAAVELGRRASLRDAGVLEHQLLVSKGKPTRVVPRAGKRAVARYRVLARKGGRALVELAPETGRTHQLRVQLAHVGAPIAGDGEYGGPAAARLMLHSKRLELPSLSEPIQATLPECFQQWLETGEVALGSSWQCALEDAACLRAPIARVSETFRWVNGAGDLLPGVVVDVYGDWVVLATSTVEASEHAERIAEHLVTLGVRGVYHKQRARADLRRRDVTELAPSGPLVGWVAPEPCVVSERVVLDVSVESRSTATASTNTTRPDELRLATWLGDGLSTGLFVDQRDNRVRVRSWATGQRLLNLFSYTCSFSVAAALGGATETVSVDLSGRALERGRLNFELNGIAAAQHRFVKADAVKWLRKAAHEGERFGVIVLDPPSFSTHAKRTFNVAERYAEVASLALALLEPGGKLLAVTNHRKTSLQAFRRMLHRAAEAAGVRVRQMKDLPSGLDCPDGPQGPEPSKSVLVVRQ